MLQSRFWVTFGSLAVKIADFWSLSCLLTDKDIGNTIRSLRLIFFDDVGIETFRCGNACVAQLLRYRDYICTVCQEDRSHRVAECMRIDVGQAVAGGEVFEPAGDAVRTHVIAVVLGEYIAGMQPAIAVQHLQTKLLSFVMPQQIHRFSR